MFSSLPCSSSLDLRCNRCYCNWGPDFVLRVESGTCFVHILSSLIVIYARFDDNRIKEDTLDIISRPFSLSPSRLSA